MKRYVWLKRWYKVVQKFTKRYENCEKEWIFLFYVQHCKDGNDYGNMVTWFYSRHWFKENKMGLWYKWFLISYVSIVSRVSYSMGVLLLTVNVILVFTNYE